MASPAPALSPFQIFDAMTSFEKSAVLKGAIELDVFTTIADGATSVPAIAAKCSASERGIRILCDYLTIHGFLTKSGSEYGLTAESAAFLSKRSHTYLGVAVGFLNHPMIMSAFNDVAGTVRKGGTLLGGNGSVEPGSGSSTTGISIPSISTSWYRY